MGNIDLTELYKQKKNEFKDTGLTRFENDFVSAVNWIASKINRQADLETAIAKITSPSGELGLSEDYIDVVSDGVTIRLVQFGHRGRAGDVDIQAIRAELNENIDMIRQDLLNTATASSLDDDDNYMIFGGTEAGSD